MPLMFSDFVGLIRNDFQTFPDQAIDFFDNISVANTSYFFKCEESSLNDNATIFGYWKWTGGCRKSLQFKIWRFTIYLFLF